ncbi:MAG: hypothetical protein UT39_C0002G0010 [Candidatus Woesebacteria bacterium GW2011_GWA1_39_21]|uniref:Glycosyltransferase RgtA/B/C/D-like domain-containing protein n=1 Tax=Candidatus Woesebacteria bacterium GW2011_GWA1_39_21 TaxID=1618550 RepID=A0A0G0N6M6_9BACT|nr:MAG: hypothetical protein UT39_C0002G0010 [Candidatus Woesebacteria bacterium GW2011_GWA1_39_21]
MRFISKINLSTILVILLIAFLFFLPDTIGYLKSDTQHKYSGNSYTWDPWDVNVYVSVIKYSQINGFKYKNLFTTQAGDNKTIVYPIYTLFGTLFRTTNPFILYNISTLLFVPFLLVSIYYFTKTLSSSHKTALLSTLTAAFAGGFGWLVYGFGINSADLTVTPFMLLNVFQRPHATLSLSLYILSLSFFYKFTKSMRFKYITLSTLLFFFSGYIYPYLYLSYAIVVLSFAVAIYLKNKYLPYLVKTILSLTFLGLCGGTYALYILNAKGLESVLSPSLNTPVFVSFLLGCGIFIIPFVTEIKKIRSDNSFLFIYFLISSQIILAYLPFGFARYYLLGIFIPLSFLTASFLESLPHGIRKVIAILFLTASFFTSFFIQLDRVLKVQNMLSPYYWNSNDLAALDFLQKNYPKNIVATYPFSNYIPAISGNSVYFGHYFQTPNSVEKIAELTSFFNNKMSENEARSFLNSNNIDFVVWKNESELWSQFPRLDKPSYRSIKEVFKNQQVVIWKVERED